MRQLSWWCWVNRNSFHMPAIELHQAGEGRHGQRGGPLLPSSRPAERGLPSWRNHWVLPLGVGQEAALDVKRPVGSLGEAALIRKNARQ